MRKKTNLLNITCTLFLLMLCAASSVYPANIFIPAMEEATKQAVDNWISGNNKDLKAALERLTRNEAYLCAIGESTREKSYLARIPKSLNENMDSIAAYLFLIQKEKEGIELWPKSFFEGQSFTFNPKGGEQ